MAIFIKKIRLQDFRTFENAEMFPSNTSLIVGENNSGKSNLLRAIYIGLNPAARVVKEDLRIDSDGETADKAIIDIMLRDSEADMFSKDWINIFKQERISIGGIVPDNYNFFGVRTIIQYDNNKKDYLQTKYKINQWDDKVVASDQQLSWSEEMYEAIQIFFVDAQRDILEDMRERKSFFGQTTELDISEEKRKLIETGLSQINGKIIDTIPNISILKKKLSPASALGSRGEIGITPLARTIDDLRHDMNITYRDSGSFDMPISQQGMGTRSLTSLLSLEAYVASKYTSNEINKKIFMIYLLEEPEAHLHPQAQRLLYNQITKLNAQIFITTHSPTFLSFAGLKDLFHLGKTDGITSIRGLLSAKLEYTDEERELISKYGLDGGEIELENVNKEHRQNAIEVNSKMCNSIDYGLENIKNHILRTKGFILFSKALVFCEGLTEVIAIPIFFERYFGKKIENFDIDIVDVGGHKMFPSFVRLAEWLQIPWFIFCDGEAEALKTLHSIATDLGVKIEDIENIIYIPDNKDYETHIVESVNNLQIIIDCIDEYENKKNKKNTQHCKNRIISLNNQQKETEDKTVYSLEDSKTIVKIVKEEKILYAEPVACRLVKNEVLPSSINKLFITINKHLNLKECD